MRARPIRFLIRFANLGHEPSDCEKITREFRDALQNQDCQVGNFRVSKIAVEFDLFIEQFEDLDRILSIIDLRVEQILTVKKLNGENCKEFEENFTSSLQLYEAERFCEVHEVLESIWMKVHGKEKELLHGLILGAIALVHLQKDRKDRYFSILQRAFPLLEGAKNYRGLDVKKMRKEVEKIVVKKEILRPTLSLSQ